MINLSSKKRWNYKYR